MEKIKETLDGSNVNRQSMYMLLILKAKLTLLLHLQFGCEFLFFYMHSLLNCGENEVSPLKPFKCFDRRNNILCVCHSPWGSPCLSAVFNQCVSARGRQKEEDASSRF